MKCFTLKNSILRIFNFVRQLPLETDSRCPGSGGNRARWEHENGVIFRDQIWWVTKQDSSIDPVSRFHSKTCPVSGHAMKKMNFSRHLCTRHPGGSSWRSYKSILSWQKIHFRGPKIMIFHSKYVAGPWHYAFGEILQKYKSQRCALIQKRLSVCFRVSKHVVRASTVWSYEKPVFVSSLLNGSTVGNSCFGTVTKCD